MKKFNIGSTVVTPKNRKATVKGIILLRTGRVGRPRHALVVQERDDRGHFVGGTHQYLPSQLVRSR